MARRFAAPRGMSWLMRNYAADADRTRQDEPLITRLLPEYEFSERHATEVAAPAHAVEAAILELDLGSSPLARVLFALRCMPARTLRLEGLEQVGFCRLAYAPGQEVVLGLIGKFWTLRGGLLRITPQDFEDFDRPGYAKAAWNFRLTPRNATHTRLETETRVHCTDAVSRARFARYWKVVRPFSGLIRREALRLVRRSAEQGVRPNP